LGAVCNCCDGGRTGFVVALVFQRGRVMNGGASQFARVLTATFRPMVSEEAFNDWAMQDLIDRADAKTPFEEEKENDK
jgi:hypothetical protein